MARAPLLLATPSAWSGASRGRARLLLALLALLAVAAAGLAGTPSGDDGRRGFAVDTGLVEGVRHGDDYYNVAADLARGGEVPERALVAVRLPTLTVIAAPLPARVVSALLATLALAVALAWYERLTPALARSGARLAGVVLLLAGLAASFRHDAAVTAETWAGLLVALSLARWRPGRASEAIGWALAAALIDERAAVAIVVMAVFAWIARARREAVGWTIALAVFALVVLVHRHAIDAAGILFADAPREGPAGVGSTLAGLHAATALAALPVAIAAPATVLGIAGWSAWRDPLAPRVVAALLAFVALGILSPAGAGAALLAAPLSLAGLLFLPDGLRDLTLDTPRIVVRRVTR
jgi:hypothetical protein